MELSELGFAIHPQEEGEKMPIELDGSMGQGGGQILQNGLAPTGDVLVTVGS